MSDNKNTVNEPFEGYGQNEPLNFDKVWIMFKETESQMKKTDERIDRLAKMYGGLAENTGAMAEEFFKRGLENRDTLFGIKYKEVGALSKHRGKLQGEYDIVLYNGDTMIVIEVKYKLHPNSVQNFYDEQLPLFKVLFPEYADKKIIGAVAGMAVPKESEDLAKELGLLVLTQSGDSINLANEEGFELTFF